MIFITDENISHRIARMLDSFDRNHQVRAHCDFFDPGTPDIDWLKEAGSWKPKPAVLGGDGRILRNRVEVAELKSAKLTFVYLKPRWMHIDYATRAWKMVRVWPEIVEAVARTRRPAVLEVPVTSQKVQHICFVADLLA